MTELGHDDPAQLSAAEEADLVRYGAISPFALGALALGLLSITVLTSLLAIPVPLVAVILALIALRQIHKSDGAIVGGWVALLGLALALVFASTAIARLASREYLIRGQARQFADQWLELVRLGKLHQAHQLHLLPAERQLPDTKLAAFYNNSEAARGQFTSFYNTKPLRLIVDAPPAAELRFARFGQRYPLPDSEQIELFYDLHTAAAADRSLEAIVVAERIAQGRGPGVWRIAAVTDPSQQLQPP
jgi:hypothetical protein